MSQSFQTSPGKAPPPGPRDDAADAAAIMADLQRSLGALDRIGAGLASAYLAMAIDHLGEFIHPGSE